MATNKSKSGTVIVWLLAIVLVSGGFFAIQQFSIDSTARDGDFISVPTYGILKCEQSDNIVSVPSNGYQLYSSEAITCQGKTGDSLAQSCTVTLKTPDASELASRLSKPYSGLGYSVCTAGQTCDVDAGDAFQNWLSTRHVGNNNEANLNKEINIQLQPNQYLRTEFQEWSLGDQLSIPFGANPDTLVNKGRWKLNYQPFFVVKYDVFSASTGREVPGSQDCVIGNEQELNFLIEDVRGAGKLSVQLEESELLNKASIRDPGAVMTYISNFVAIVPQYDLFEDGSKYCYDKRIYAVEEIETPGGVYRVADTSTNKELETVECCNNGDVGTGQYCDDFEIKDLSSSTGGQCNALTPCPLVGGVAVPGGKVATQECVSGICETTYIDVDCNYNAECPGGYCEVDNLNPRNNKCVFVEPQEFCGNGVCEYSRGENIDTCSQDCQPYVPPGGVDLTVWLIVLGVVAILLLMLAIKKKQGGGKITGF